MVAVSIITVVYNSKNLITKTIESVLEQDFHDFEYLIIDGDSNDGTQEIINRYHDKINFILSEKDNGIFDAMNKGIRNANGKWLLFLNSGDTFYSKNTLSKIPFNNLSNFYLIFGNTITDNIIRKPFNQASLKSGIIYACHQSMLFNKELLKSELFYDLTFKLFSEYDLISRIYKNKYPIYYYNYCISNYLGGGISSQVSLEARKAKYYFVYKNFGLIGILNSILFKLKFIKLRPYAN